MPEEPEDLEDLDDETIEHLVARAAIFEDQAYAATLTTGPLLLRIALALVTAGFGYVVSSARGDLKIGEINLAPYAVGAVLVILMYVQSHAQQTRAKALIHATKASGFHFQMRAGPDEGVPLRILRKELALRTKKQLPKLRIGSDHWIKASDEEHAELRVPNIRAPRASPQVTPVGRSELVKLGALTLAVVLAYALAMLTPAGVRSPESPSLDQTAGMFATMAGFMVFIGAFTVFPSSQMQKPKPHLMGDRAEDLRKMADFWVRLRVGLLIVCVILLRFFSGPFVNAGILAVFAGGWLTASLIEHRAREAAAYDTLRRYLATHRDEWIPLSEVYDAVSKGAHLARHRAVTLVSRKLRENPKWDPRIRFPVIVKPPRKGSM